MECETALLFAADHPAFAGHFPGFPIVPGVLLLDAALHAQATASGRAVAEIASAKFLHPVKPDQRVALSLEVAETARVRFAIADDAQRVASGQLIMACAP